MRFNLPRQLCIDLWNVAGALQSPKGMWSHLKKTQVTYCEGSVLLQCILHLYLPEPWFEVQVGKMCSTYQTLQSLLNPGLGVGVLFCVSIKAAEVDADLQATIPLPYQYHCSAPHTLAGPDSARPQHLLHVVPDLLNQWQGNPPKWLFKRICHL